MHRSCKFQILKLLKNLSKQLSELWSVSLLTINFKMLGVCIEIVAKDLQIPTYVHSCSAAAVKKASWCSSYCNAPDKRGYPSPLFRWSLASWKVWYSRLLAFKASEPAGLPAKGEGLTIRVRVVRSILHGAPPFQEIINHVRSRTITNLRAANGTRRGCRDQKCGPCPNTSTDPWCVRCGGSTIWGITCSTWFYPHRNAFGCQLISIPNFFNGTWPIYGGFTYIYLWTTVIFHSKPVIFFTRAATFTFTVSWKPAVIFGFSHGHQAQEAP